MKRPTETSLCSGGIEVSVSPGSGKRGNRHEDEVITKVKLYSALDALRLLAKHHALLTEVVAVKDLPHDERELDALIEHHLKRVYGPEKGEAIAKALLRGETTH